MAFDSDEVISADGVRLHVVRAGSGPAVVLLHGFPEFWYSWRHQISPLAAAGFSVLAPDLRGFNRSDKPRGVGHYEMPRLVNDVAALAKASGQSRVHLVGHDWGGMVAWHAAAFRPDLVDRLTIVNAPHPTVYGRRFWRSGQWLRSAYVPLFMISGLTAPLLSAWRYFLLRQMFVQGAGRHGVFTSDVLSTYATAASQPGALEAGLNYYRANARLGFAPPAFPRIEAPTLVVWGERDPALGTDLLNGLDKVVRDLRIERLPGVGHWVQSEAPEQLTSLLLSHLLATPA